MGQGAEDAGGYLVDYEWQCESDEWRGNQKINEMSIFELKRAISYANDRAQCAQFSGDRQIWIEWVNELSIELLTRKPEPAKYSGPSVKAAVRGSKMELVCHCGKEYQARIADLKRGYGKSCCKRCSAIRREYRKPPAKTKDGKSIKQALKELKR